MSSTNELVKVDNGGTGGVVSLDPAAMLSAVRTALEASAPPLMTTAQSFMIAGAPLLPDSEDGTPLSEALVTPSGQSVPVLTVATPHTNLPTNKKWSSLTSGQQVSFLNDVAQMTHGLTIGDPAGGNKAEDMQMYKTTHDALTAIEASMYTSDVPRIQTSITENSYFSKFAQSVATSSSNSVSLSVSTPYGGGESSFKEAKSRTTSSSKVTTYSVGTYNVNVAVVELDKDKLTLASDFAAALLAAAELTGEQDQFVALVEALNEYGWYVPTKFMVGGVLYTTEQTETETWSDVQTTETDFSASFKGSFDGIGGGAAYDNAHKSSTSHSGAHGSKSLSFTAIGGEAADSNDFAKWSASLADADNWNISGYEAMIPSVYPLRNMGSSNVQLLSFIANNIANQYANCPELQTLQPIIDCGAYAKQVKNMLGPFG